MSYTMTNVEMLDNMTFNDLEAMKRQLETVRQRILLLQNSRSLLFKLPGELRNKIFLFAMEAELLERKKQSRHAPMFREPAFFATSRQIKAECTSVWFNDILVWEELIDLGIPDTSTPIKVNDKAAHIETVQTDCSGLIKAWKRMPMDQVKQICSERSKVGKLTLVTQAAHCDLKRSREAVESSRSICPRRGLVRVKGVDSGMMALRWWVW